VDNKVKRVTAGYTDVPQPENRKQSTARFKGRDASVHYASSGAVGDASRSLFGRLLEWFASTRPRQSKSRMQNSSDGVRSARAETPKRRDAVDDAVDIVVPVKLNSAARPGLDANHHVAENKLVLSDNAIDENLTPEKPPNA
jgi:hypothetical protein